MPRPAFKIGGIDIDFGGVAEGGFKIESGGRINHRHVGVAAGMEQLLDLRQGIQATWRWWEIPRRHGTARQFGFILSLGLECSCPPHEARC